MINNLHIIKFNGCFFPGTNWIKISIKIKTEYFVQYNTKYDNFQTI